MDRLLNQRTYENLKKDIMTFGLMPGEPVSAAKIAQRYRVSRTPAREALVMLQGEGLVDIFPQSRSVISKINVRRIRQEWFVRRTLELAMVDEFFDRVRKEDIDEMKHYAKLLEAVGAAPETPENAYKYLEYDNLFHAVAYRAAREELAASVIEKSMSHYNRARLMIDMDAARKERTTRDHARLIKLLEAEDRDGYREVLGIHLGYIEADIREMNRNRPDMFEMEE